MQSGLDSDDIKKMVNLSLMNGENVSHEEIIKIFEYEKNPAISDREFAF